MGKIMISRKSEIILTTLLTIWSVIQSGNPPAGWTNSGNLDKWYTPLDLCVLSNDTANSIESIMDGCAAKLLSTIPTVTSQPPRCRVGNSWPSKGGFCSPADIPYSGRDLLRMASIGFDDPTQHPLRKLFTSLSKERGALLLLGDSVMQQYYSAMACELEREGIWDDVTQFKNTGDLKYVNIKNNDSEKQHSVPIRFTPIYNFVNGKYETVPNASMHHLRKATETFIEKYDSVMIVMNVGLHYLSNPVPRFSRPDYTVQITEALQYLHDKVTEFKGKKNIRVIWRETSAQHFPTSNGYWPGVKYAEEMDVKCVPIKDTREEADWRNKDANNIIIKNKFNISIAPFYKQTEPLWGMHVNGHLRDCTHLCWTPMLYQKLFHLLADFMMPSKEIIK